MKQQEESKNKKPESLQKKGQEELTTQHGQGDLFKESLEMVTNMKFTERELMEMDKILSGL
jgi:hypothetical protein